MIKQTITYDNFDDATVTEDFYFNLSKLEILEMEIDFEGGLRDHIMKLTQTDVGPEAYHLFKDILVKAYGKRSEDGRRFEKSPEIAKEFEESPALGELIIGFLTNGVDAAAFVKGLLPAKLVAEAEREATATPAELPTTAGVPSDGLVAVSSDPVTSTTRETELKFEDYSREDLLTMPEEEFLRLLPAKQSEWNKDQLLVAMQRRTSA
jgi:hypothetical protein